MSDDEIIGLKSTSIKFKKHIKLFVSICYLISSILLILLLYDKIRFNLSSLFIILFFFSLINQIIIFNKKKPLTCLNAFKQNNYSGLFLFLGLYLESINYGI